jgi:hypothetical protein
VAHSCNLRRQRSGGSQFEVSLGKQFVRPYLKKNLSQNRDGGVPQGEGPKFKPQYCKRKTGMELLYGSAIPIQKVSFL